MDKEENRYEMTEEKYDLFFRGLCSECKGHLEEDWSAAQVYQGYEHSIYVYKCIDCGELFAEYLSEDPEIIDCVEYYDY